MQQKYKLVLVEDSDDDVILFELALRRAGLCEVYHLEHRFPNGEEALEYFLNHSKTLDPQPLPDILILDLKLPGCSGLDVLAEIAPMRPRPAIAVFTTSILPEDRQQAETLGVDLFQTKAFEATQFARFLHFLARISDERRAGLV